MKSEIDEEGLKMYQAKSKSFRMPWNTFWFWHFWNPLKFEISYVATSKRPPKEQYQRTHKQAP